MDRDNIVRGSNVVTYIFHDGMWKVLACGRSCTYETTTELIEVTVAGSGKFKSWRPTVNSWSGSIEGVVMLDEVNKLGVADVRQLQLAHTLLMISYERTSEGGSVYTDRGYIWITNVADTGSKPDVASWTLTFTGEGEPSQIFVSTPTENGGTLDTITFTASGGETTFTSPLLENVDIVGVSKDGVIFTLGSGTPVGKEYVYDDDAGTVTFEIPAEPNEKIFVQYQSL